MRKCGPRDVFVTVPGPWNGSGLLKEQAVEGLCFRRRIDADSRGEDRLVSMISLDHFCFAAELPVGLHKAEIELLGEVVHVEAAQVPVHRLPGPACLLTGQGQRCHGAEEFAAQPLARRERPLPVAVAVSFEKITPVLRYGTFKEQALLVA